MRVLAHLLTLISSNQQVAEIAQFEYGGIV